MQAFILAGGKGTRLKERLAGRPKPLIDVGGVPLLERQIRLLEQNGVEDIVLLVNHAADQIEAFVAERAFSARVTLIDDGDPRGTAGAVLACLDQMQAEALIVYGDTLFDVDLRAMWQAHEDANADATLMLHPNDHPFDSDLVEISPDNWITRFHSYPHPATLDYRNLVNAALYIVKRSALEPWRGASTPSDFAKDLFPAMVAAGQPLLGYSSMEYIKDLGTPKRLDKVERHIASGVVERARRAHLQKAVFLDRDGTLNVLAGFLCDADALRLIDGAGPAVRKLNDAEYRTVIVTNQPVIARGECDLAGLDHTHRRLEKKLGEDGAFVNRILFCPHHPDKGFAGEVASLKIVCDCRKPATGMIDTAIAEMGIDRHSAWMIGDSTADMLAANRAGLSSILVQTGEGGRDGKYPGIADLIAADVSAAVDIITDHYPRMVAPAAALATTIGRGEVIMLHDHDPDRAALFAVALRTALRQQGFTAQMLAATSLPSTAHELRAADWLTSDAVHSAESHLLPKDGVLVLHSSNPDHDPGATARTIHYHPTPA